MVSRIKKKYRYSKPSKPQRVKPIYVIWDYTPLGRLFVKEVLG